MVEFTDKKMLKIFNSPRSDVTVPFCSRMMKYEMMIMILHLLVVDSKFEFECSTGER